jgi:hypothetical protein
LLNIEFAGNNNQSWGGGPFLVRGIILGTQPREPWKYARDLNPQSMVRYDRLQKTVTNFAVRKLAILTFQLLAAAISWAWAGSSGMA